MTNLLLILLLLVGCSPTEPENVHGCLDSQACNYNSSATIDNNSCWYATDGCDCDDAEGSEIDMCGVCNTDTTNDCAQDECGVWGGSGVDADDDGTCDDVDECIGQYDDCGVCNGNNDAMDECGNCQGQEAEWVELWGECYNIEQTTELDLDGITGEIPSSIGQLINLTKLWLHNNQLTGEIPPEIGNLTNLTSLSLSNNQFTGEIPSEIGNLTNLTSLYLYDNQFSGEIPQEVCDLIESNDLWMNYTLSGNDDLINTCD